MPEHREWRDGYDSPQARPDQRVSYESRRERARRERLRQGLADEGMWDRVSSCAKKRRYATYDQARAVARWGEEENGRELRIYKCEYCGGWHLTHKLDQKVYGREAGREATERIAREQAESTAAAPLARWSVGDLVLDLASNTLHRRGRGPDGRRARLPARECRRVMRAWLGARVRRCGGVTGGNRGREAPSSRMKYSKADQRVRILGILINFRVLNSRGRE